MYSVNVAVRPLREIIALALSVAFALNFAVEGSAERVDELLRRMSGNYTRFTNIQGEYELKGSRPAMSQKVADYLLHRQLAQIADAERDPKILRYLRLGLRASMEKSAHEQHTINLSPAKQEYRFKFKYESASNLFLHEFYTPRWNPAAKPKLQGFTLIVGGRLYRYEPEKHVLSIRFFPNDIWHPYLQPLFLLYEQATPAKGAIELGAVRKAKLGRNWRVELRIGKREGLKNRGCPQADVVILKGTYLNGTPIILSATYYDKLGRLRRVRTYKEYITVGRNCVIPAFSSAMTCDYIGDTAEKIAGWQTTVRLMNIDVCAELSDLSIPHSHLINIFDATLPGLDGGAWFLCRRDILGLQEEIIGAKPSPPLVPP